MLSMSLHKEDKLKKEMVDSIERLKMKVVEEGGFGAIAAQHVYHAEANNPTLVGVRTVSTHWKTHRTQGSSLCGRVSHKRLY